MDIGISIIIPFYHGNRYIEKLLNVIQKSRMNLISRCDCDAEIIIVNDSPDEKVIASGMIVDNVRVINNPHNQGIHQSRVNGLSEAKGKYILFLDQDDLITDDCLLSQINAIGSYDFVVGNGYKTDSEHKYKLYAITKAQKKCLKQMHFYCYTCPIISPGLVLIRKDAIPEDWKSNILKHNGSDDFYLWLLMFENGAKGTVNPSCVYAHVFTGQNTSLDANYMRESTQEFVNLLKEKVPKWKTDCIMRRTDYFCNNRGRLTDKLKYADVCLLRFLFGKLL